MEAMQCTDTVLMIRPNHFGFNETTAASNAFQRMPDHLTAAEVHERALVEFEGLRHALTGAGIHVLVCDDTDDPHTPDAVFPNNWFTTHQDGSIVIYPLQGENRRHERRQDIVQMLQDRFGFQKIVDLTGAEQQGKFLEGTGSMVIDHIHRTVYSCLSTRTHEDLLRTFAGTFGYREVVSFRADVKTNEETGFDRFHPIYHTNVMMALGTGTAVICAESIRDDHERGKVLSSLWASAREVVEITVEQLHRFAGNMLQLMTTRGNPVWIMSSNAFTCLTPRQRMALQANGATIVHSPLDTIELVGGGSARCMIAEIFRPTGA
jgi:hypothetical protein